VHQQEVVQHEEVAYQQVMQEEGHDLLQQPHPQLQEPAQESPHQHH
jgi:hypothetical protein